MVEVRAGMKEAILFNNEAMDLIRDLSGMCLHSNLSKQDKLIIARAMYHIARVQADSECRLHLAPEPKRTAELKLIASNEAE
jgi:hypothetical protein